MATLLFVQALMLEAFTKVHIEVNTVNTKPLFRLCPDRGRFPNVSALLQKPTQVFMKSCCKWWGRA